MGLSSELGALVMGVLLSTHGRAKELGKSLWSLKEGVSRRLLQQMVLNRLRT